MKIGVIGAGTMGQGIAKAFAQVEGNTVALCDIKQEWAENGLAKIKKGYEKLVAKGKMTQEKADAIVAAITPGLKEDLCADCDLVVEAAFEDMKVKQTTFGELDKICKPECIFASNTSSLSITEIGKGVSRPLVGMHFFNPADRMKLIEVIAGCNTPAETVEKIKEISVAIGKQPVQVNEAAGFVVNRILIPMINEAAFIKMEAHPHRSGRSALSKSSPTFRLWCKGGGFFRSGSASTFDFLISFLSAWLSSVLPRLLLWRRKASARSAVSFFCSWSAPPF